MAHHLLLRWSGRGDTVERHKDIAAEHGSVWWGKWAKSAEGRDPISSDTREELATQIGQGVRTWAYLHNAQQEWRAVVLEIRDRGFRPPAEQVPDYYPDRQPIDMWVRLGDFEPLP